MTAHCEHEPEEQGRCVLAELCAALHEEESEVAKTIDRLREIAPAETENEVYDLTFGLRDAQALMGCLRRLVAGRTPAEIHAAFGSPGDFGYHSPIGAALDRLYRGKAVSS